MPRYSVILGLQVTQGIDVDADSVEAAIEAAECEGMDQPNISNKFDAAGDVEALAVLDADGETVWEADR